LADRFKIVYSNSGSLPSNIIHSRQSLTSGDMPNSFYHYRIAPDGAGSGFGVNDFYLIDQRIENGVRFLCGLNKTVTVSFYARSSITDKRLGVSLAQNYGTGGTPSSEEQIKMPVTPITLTSSWTKYTCTFTTNTLSGKTFGTNNNDSLILRFWEMWGATTANTYLYSSVSAEDFVGSGNIDIAQVQLCAGDIALPFQPKSFEAELRACQRYYYLQKRNRVHGFAYSTTNIRAIVDFPTSMRTAPTATLIDNSPIITQTNSAFTGSSSSIVDQVTTTDAGLIRIGGFTGLTAGLPIHDNQDNALSFSAEL